MLYVSFIGKTPYGSREVLDMFVDSELPNKQSDIEYIKTRIKDKYNQYAQITILNWKELDD